jgi:hypothetical protein
MTADSEALEVLTSILDKLPGIGAYKVANTGHALDLTRYGIEPHPGPCDLCGTDHAAASLIGMLGWLYGANSFSDRLAWLARTR